MAAWVDPGDADTGMLDGFAQAPFCLPVRGLTSVAAQTVYRVGGIVSQGLKERDLSVIDWTIVIGRQRQYGQRSVVDLQRECDFAPRAFTETSACL
jgi:hypothetical protein